MIYAVYKHDRLQQRNARNISVICERDALEE